MFSFWFLHDQIKSLGRKCVGVKILVLMIPYHQLIQIKNEMSAAFLLEIPCMPNKSVQTANTNILHIHLTGYLEYASPFNG